MSDPSSPATPTAVSDDPETKSPGESGADAAPIPKRIGGFAVLDVLGRGGMGRVYLAKQESLDRLVALKVLHPELAKDKTYLERFLREARAAALFQHPNVVAVIDTGRSEAGEQYIAFEFIDGGSLEALVRAQGRVPERRALEITRAIAKALVFAESKGLVHRDLKPANILIAADGTPKLADLGLVRHDDPEMPGLTQAGIVLGTPLYMAPEQALGKAKLDVRADIYALGLSLYRMVTGLVPFNESEDTCSTLAILSRHVNEELPDVRGLVPGASAGLAALLAGMTAREVEARYRSAAHVVADVDRLLAGQPVLGPKLTAAAQREADEAPTTAVSAARVAEAALADGPTQAVGAVPAAARGAAAQPGPRAAAEPGPAPAADEGLDAAALAPGGGRARPTPTSASGGARPLVAGVVGLVAIAALAAWFAVPRPSAGGADAAGPAVEGDATAGAGGGVAVTPPADAASTGEPPPVDPPPPPAGSTVTTDPAAPTTPPTGTDPVALAAKDPASPLPPPETPGDAVAPTQATPPTTPPTTTDDARPEARRDPVDLVAALSPRIAAARGDPRALAAVLPEVGRLLFTELEAGERAVELLLARAGWAEDPARARYVEVHAAALEALVPGLGWDERERRLGELRVKARRQAPLPGEVGRAVDLELDAWAAFADAAPRLRRALGDPRTDEQALGATAPIPADRGVRDDARALLAMSFVSDRPERWLRLDERRRELQAEVRDARARIARSALGRALEVEVAALGAVVARQLEDPDACQLEALWRVRAGKLQAGGRAAEASAFVAARLTELPANASSSNLRVMALLLELAEPPQGTSLSVFVDELEVELTVGALAVGKRLASVDTSGLRWLVVEPRLDAVVVRLEATNPYEVRARRREASGPSVFSVRRLGDLPVARVVLLRTPERTQAQERAPARGDLLRQGGR